MPELEANIADFKHIPDHVVVVMDGNGRWAKRKGLQRIMGHRNAIGAVRAVTETAAELGCRYLTLYAFSTENWGRPKLEVDSLMELLVDAVEKEEATLQKNNVRLRSIGNMKALPEHVATRFDRIVAKTASNTGLTLVVALSYSGRWDLQQAIANMMMDVKQGNVQPDEVSELLVNSYLQTTGMPDPDLFIRTGGDKRVSNFLLWQIAYTELYFTETLWPDFRRNDFLEAVADFQTRERRFGMVLDNKTDEV